MIRVTKDLPLIPSAAMDCEGLASSICNTIDILNMIAGTDCGRVIVARIAREYGVEATEPDLPEPPLGILHNQTT